MIHDQSRLTLSDIIEFVDPNSGKLLRRRYVDIRLRVTTESDDDRFIAATDARQWPHVGSQFMDDARNWWVVADLSEVVDPFEDLIAEKTLRIPSMSRFIFRIMTGDET